MSSFKVCAFVAILLATYNNVTATPWQALGRSVTSEEFASWDIDVRPDGVGLPQGSGSVANGEAIYDEQCAACHGSFGESTDYIAIAGGVGTLASDVPQRTVGSKLNYPTTLWDYINRAMPFQNSKSLSADEVYAVTAYVLNLNDIVAADAVLDQNNLALVKMPNRDGFTLAHGMAAIEGTPDVSNRPCMTDCAPADVAVTSQLPAGFTAQMYGNISSHFRNFSANAPPARSVTSGTIVGLEAAKANACLACHGVSEARIGPALADIGERYAQDRNAATSLANKVREGSSGAWGNIPMPAQKLVSDAALTEILSWILSGAHQQ
jgi:cytochrome c551/c552